MAEFAKPKALIDVIEFGLPSQSRHVMERRVYAIIISWQKKKAQTPVCLLDKIRKGIASIEAACKCVGATDNLLIVYKITQLKCVVWN